ncbi:hypothetical protein [uncultured Thalassolituus sp.]|uniref:hypothetical protein n=1 Tax=uncultured Thalassolituus sp. TaxID=285273 RepID=UPI00261F215F|nr:hypothetical protein [uncultured Thalassolituus sp.]
MKVLERKRNGLQALFVPIAVGGFFWAILSKLSMPLAVSGFTAAIAFLIPLVMVLNSIRKPAAWIQGDTLNIRGGFSSTTRISLSSVENMRYLAGIQVNGKRGGIVRDALYVKLKGFDEWEIPIPDSIDHIKDGRLYKFINENFYELPYQEQTN